MIYKIEFKRLFPQSRKSPPQPLPLPPAAAQNLSSDFQNWAQLPKEITTHLSDPLQLNIQRRMCLLELLSGWQQTLRMVFPFNLLHFSSLKNIAHRRAALRTLFRL